MHPAIKKLGFLLFNIYLCSILSALALESEQPNNSEWDKVRFFELPEGKYNVSMGSGFFITNDHIITNYHVVKKCKNIAIRGAVKPCLAKLKHFSEEKDLAILESFNQASNIPNKLPYLRFNNAKVKIKDEIISVGYPLEHSTSGTYVIGRALITNIISDNKSTLFEFTDSVDHGNSGGPLLDNSLNIIGVVTSRVTYADSAGNKRSFGSAISVSGLIEFLNQYQVKYFGKDTYDIFVDYRANQSAENYVVNIHCIY